jgi:enoyl-[acyl-carrier protein] reductase III
LQRVETNGRRLTGRVALVTGGSRGIGRAIALTLAREGAAVVVNFRDRADAAASTARQIRDEGGCAAVVQANVALPDEITRMFDSVGERFGGLDALICNAAAGVPGPLLQTTAKAWDLAMNVNARALLLCAQRAVPLMRARGAGRIVALTARLAVERYFDDYGPIAPSKAALEALTTYLAVELGPDHITVNALSPGFVATEALDHFSQGPEALRRAAQRTPLGRATTPEDVAQLAAFLCADEAAQITGQVIQIDGGYGRLLP